MRLNLSPIGSDNSLADVLAYLSDLILLLMLLLNFLMLHVLSLFSLLTVLLVVAESWSVPSNVMRRWHWRSISRWRMRSDG